MTSQQIIEQSLPILAYHRQCRIEMTRLMWQRSELERWIEARGQVQASPMLLKVDLDKVREMIEN